MMSGFCVFGVTRQDCLKRARAKVRTIDPKTKKELSPAEWAERVQVVADELFNIAKSKQISPAMDSPQFCVDWIDVGERTGQIRGAKIMAKGKKVDAKGRERTRKGIPVIGWVPYEAAASNTQMRRAA
jgi:hypothetical protein